MAHFKSVDRNLSSGQQGTYRLTSRRCHSFPDLAGLHLVLGECNEVAQKDIPNGMCQIVLPFWITRHQVNKWMLHHCHRIYWNLSVLTSSLRSSAQALGFPGIAISQIFSGSTEQRKRHVRYFYKFNTATTLATLTRLILFYSETAPVRQHI